MSRLIYGWITALVASMPLGLGYANLGALLMSRGLAYDSDEGRDFAAAVTAVMHGEAYRQSSVVARDHGGAFVEYAKNREPFLRVVRKHRAALKDVDRTIEYLREEYKITDRKLTIMGLGILAFVIFLFVIHGVLHMEPSVAALIGAMVLLAISRVDIVEMLEHEVEWPTLVFFMALFIRFATPLGAGLGAMAGCAAAILRAMARGAAVGGTGSPPRWRSNTCIHLGI